MKLVSYTRLCGGQTQSRYSGEETDILPQSGNKPLFLGPSALSPVITPIKFICLTTGPCFSSTPSSPQSGIQVFLFQFPVSFHFLKMLTSSSLSSLRFYPSSYLSFNNVFYKTVAMLDVKIQLAFLLFIVCTIFLSSLTLCNTSSFLTRSMQLISIILQHHTAKNSRYF